MALQKAVWGYGDLDVVPRPVFVIAAKTGGHVLGAFDAERLVGFALGLPAIRGGMPYIHSHFVAVLQQCQNQGVGKALKLEQRELCLQQGIRLMEWTFDPLEIANAKFNIVRLGAIVRRFLPNVYGATSSHLQGALPTDRLLAEWHLDSPGPNGSLRRSGSAPSRVRINLPANASRLKTEDAAAAKRLQERLRIEFEDLFDRGYAVTGFEIAEQGASYLFEDFRNPF